VLAAGLHRADDRAAPGRLSDVHPCRHALDEPERVELPQAFPDLGDERPTGRRHDDVVGRPPVQLFRDLVPDGLGSPAYGGC
jgi:hypothetical protein